MPSSAWAGCNGPQGGWRSLAPTFAGHRGAPLRAGGLQRRGHRLRLVVVDPLVVVARVAGRQGDGADVAEAADVLPRLDPPAAAGAQQDHDAVVEAARVGPGEVGAGAGYRAPVPGVVALHDAAVRQLAHPLLPAFTPGTAGTWSYGCPP